MTHQANIFSEADRPTTIRLAAAVATSLRGREASEEGWDSVFDFGSATSFRLWGAWFPPHPERRLPFRLRMRTLTDGDRTHLWLQFESTAGPYLFKAPGAEQVFLNRYQSVAAQIAAAPGIDGTFV